VGGGLGWVVGLGGGCGPWGIFSRWGEPSLRRGNGGKPPAEKTLIEAEGHTTARGGNGEGLRTGGWGGTLPMGAEGCLCSKNRPIGKPFFRGFPAADLSGQTPRGLGGAGGLFVPGLRRVVGPFRRGGGPASEAGHKKTRGDWRPRGFLQGGGGEQGIT